MNDKLTALLKKEIKILKEAGLIFKRSFEMCQEISYKKKYGIEELDHFEALTSRFARLSDLLVQKIFRVIDELELEPYGTARDRINRAEKKGLIESADVFVNIRLLRNEIAHEYLSSEIQRIFLHVMKWTPALLACVQKVVEYCKKYS